LWRVIGGTLILVGAFLQRKKRRIGGTISLLFGLFEMLVISFDRDILQGPYVVLVSGALLATAGGSLALVKKPKIPGEPAPSVASPGESGH
jgi:hypothetical protein